MAASGVVSDTMSLGDVDLLVDVATCSLPTAFGTFTLHCYRDRDQKEHVALVFGDTSARKDILVRIHSECFTGDILGSHRCDCGVQLRDGLQQIADEGCGVLIYLRQEGRGIGLLNKVRAYDLQDSHNLDTVDANVRLGFADDARDYRIGAAILKDLGIGSIRLMSNNPRKETGLLQSGIRLTGVVPSRPLFTNEHAGASAAYLQTKIARLNHRLPWLQKQGDTTSPNRLDRPTVVISYAQSLDGTSHSRRSR